MQPPDAELTGQNEEKEEEERERELFVIIRAWELRTASSSGRKSGSIRLRSTGEHDKSHSSVGRETPCIIAAVQETLLPAQDSISITSLENSRPAVRGLQLPVVMLLLPPV